MQELLLRAECWFRLVGRYIEPVRQAFQLYEAVRWLIKLPGHVINAYRGLRDWFRSVRDFPQRIVDSVVQQIVDDFLSRIVRPVAAIGLFALVVMVFVAAAKGTPIRS